MVRAKPDNYLINLAHKMMTHMYSPANTFQEPRDFIKSQVKVLTSHKLGKIVSYAKEQDLNQLQHGNGRVLLEEVAFRVMNKVINHLTLSQSTKRNPKRRQ